MEIQSLVDWIVSIFGDYTPVTYESTYIVGDDTIVTNIIPAGAAGVNWAYVIAGCLLLITVYSTFRIIGVLIERMGRR